MLINIDQSGSMQVDQYFTIRTNIANTEFNWPIYSKKIRNLEVLRDDLPINPQNYQVKRIKNRTSINNLLASSNEQLWHLKWQQNADISLTKNTQILRLVVFKEPGINFNNLYVSISIPENLDTAKISTQLYAIHGVDGFSTKISENKLEYFANGVSSYSTVVAIGDFPAGSFHIPYLRMLISKLANWGLSFWLGLAIILPIITFILLAVYLIHKQRLENLSQTNEYVSAPPDRLDPAMLGLLFSQRFSGRELAALILNLAIKGNILIIDEDGNYRFGEGREPSNLTNYEKVVYNELLQGRMSGGIENLLDETKEELYSQTITNIWATIYQKIASVQWFVKNPGLQSLKIKTIGVSLFLISSVLFFFAPFFSDKSYLVFLFLGTSLASLVIYSLAFTFPQRTYKGKQELENWLKFRNYLEYFPKQASYNEIHEEIFIKYLPYAIAMNCEKKWADHFSDIPFKVPEWFTTMEIIQTLPEFTQKLYPLIDQLSELMSSMKDPGEY